MRIHPTYLLTKQLQLQQIKEAIEFNETIDIKSVDPLNSEFEFPFDESITELVSDLSEREKFFGDSFEYDDIGNARCHS